MVPAVPNSKVADLTSSFWHASKCWARVKVLEVPGGVLDQNEAAHLVLAGVVALVERDQALGNLVLKLRKRVLYAG